ncbi:MAG: hypothetical protein PHG48_09410, partial [Eubacteriales bacterium]|nr:hypothetical protein [Eubacteriales bacterium]
MKLFADPLLEIAQYRELAAMFGDNPRSPERDAASGHLPKASVAGLSESQKAHFACSLCMHTGAKILFVTYNEAQAKKMYEDFSFFMGERAVFVPYVEIMPYDVEARSREALHRKTAALDRIIRGDFAAAVTSGEAASQYLPSPGV